MAHSNVGYSSWAPATSPWTGAKTGVLDLSVPGDGINRESPDPDEGLPLRSPRTDTVTDGLNTFQGVRASSPDLNQWLTPDAYAGVVHDPMSQKAYMWNRNNPVMYSDPSGYCVEDLCIGESILAGVLLRAAVAAGAAALASAAIQQAASMPRPPSVPSDWLSKPDRKGGGGTRYYNPKNEHDQVRVMPGKPNSPNPAQRDPYVVRQRQGQIVDKDGNPVNADDPSAHIPLKDFDMNRTDNPATDAGSGGTSNGTADKTPVSE